MFSGTSVAVTFLPPDPGRPQSGLNTEAGQDKQLPHTTLRNKANCELHEKE